MTSWKTYRLGEIADIQTGPFGSQLHNKDYADEGSPIVTVEHLGNRHFTTQNLPLVSDTDKARLSKYILSEGDIVFSRVGSVDRCSYVSKAEDGWMFSGRCLRVRCSSKAYPLYVYYYFCVESIKQCCCGCNNAFYQHSNNVRNTNFFAFIGRAEEDCVDIGCDR